MRRAEECLANDAAAAERAMAILERDADSDLMAKLHKAIEHGAVWTRSSMTLEFPVEYPTAPPWLVYLDLAYEHSLHEVDRRHVGVPWLNEFQDVLRHPGALSIDEGSLNNFEKDVSSGRIVKPPARVAGRPATDSDVAAERAMALLEREAKPALMASIRKAVEYGAIWVRDNLGLGFPNAVEIIDLELAVEHFQVVGMEQLENQLSQRYPGYFLS